MKLLLLSIKFVDKMPNTVAISDITQKFIFSLAVLLMLLELIVNW